MTTKTKFTPGPWNVVCVDGEYSIRKTQANGRKLVKVICKMPKRVRIEKLLANAIAIATMPDLYACLEEAAFEMCHDFSETGWCDDFDREKLRCRGKEGKCFVQRWLKTLARARGEVRG